jgi:sec-independent protein translocase protein TatC
MVEMTRPDADEPVLPVPAAADETVMSLVDHLGELRTRLFRTILAILLGAVVGFALGEHIVAILKAPIPLDSPLYFTGLGEAFGIRVRIALIVGVILAMPVILHQAWGFISPGLTPDERRAVRPWIPLALVFFALGVVVAYVVLPLAAAFLLGFATEDIQPLITAAAYFDFATMLFLAFGLVMEFPILLYGLSRVGVLSSTRLAEARRFVILGIAVFAALVTPPDVVSQVILGAVMYGLFELTLVFIRRSGR